MKKALEGEITLIDIVITNRKEKFRSVFRMKENHQLSSRNRSFRRVINSKEYRCANWFKKTSNVEGCSRQRSIKRFIKFGFPSSKFLPSPFEDVRK